MRRKIILLAALAAATGAPAAPVADDVAAIAKVTKPGRGGAVCYALARPVRRRAAITPDSVAVVACRNRAAAPLAFDRATALVVAGRDLEAGTYLGRTVVRAPPAIEKGATLMLVSIQGPVRIARPVTALQASRGGRVFVRDADGQVYAAPLAGRESRP